MRQGKTDDGHSGRGHFYLYFGQNVLDPEKTYWNFHVHIRHSSVEFLFPVDWRPAVVSQDELNGKKVCNSITNDFIDDVRNEIQPLYVFI